MAQFQGKIIRNYLTFRIVTIIILIVYLQFIDFYNVGR